MTSRSKLRGRWQHEPGLSIRSKLQDWCLDLSTEPGSREDLIRLLEGLPFREEVEGGRDLRGISLYGGLRQFDFSGFDFRYASLELNLVLCDLTRVSFDDATASQLICGVLEGATFRRTKLRGASFLDSRATKAVFDDSDLTSVSFENADLTGSSFQRARCVRTNFFGANLVGCDFREALITEAVFQNAMIDERTDFRGASLKRIFVTERRDIAGRVIGAAVDFSVARKDERTVYEPAPPAAPPVQPPDVDVKLSGPRLVRRRER